MLLVVRDIHEDFAKISQRLLREFHRLTIFEIHYESVKFVNNDQTLKLQCLLVFEYSRLQNQLIVVAKMSENSLQDKCEFIDPLNLNIRLLPNMSESSSSRCTFFAEA
jgi:hypothetical protein